MMQPPVGRLDVYPRLWLWGVMTLSPILIEDPVQVPWDKPNDELIPINNPSTYGKSIDVVPKPKDNTTG
jgi:hypothetical protein